MWVRRSDWERVTEREELVGRLSVGSRFPQYLNGGLLAGGGGTMSGIRGVGAGGSVGKGSDWGACNYLMTAMFTGAVVLAR